MEFNTFERRQRQRDFMRFLAIVVAILAVFILGFMFAYPAQAQVIEEMGSHTAYSDQLPELQVGQPWVNPMGVEIVRVSDCQAITEKYGVNAWPEVAGRIDQGAHNGYSRFPTLAGNGKYFLVFHSFNDRMVTIDRTTWEPVACSSDGRNWIGENDNPRLAHDPEGLQLYYVKNGTTKLMACDIFYRNDRQVMDFGPFNPGVGEDGHDDHIVNDWSGRYWPFRWADKKATVFDLETLAPAVPIGWTTKQPNALAGYAQGWETFIPYGGDPAVDVVAVNQQSIDGHEGYAWTVDGRQLWVCGWKGEHIGAADPGTGDVTRLFWTALANGAGFHIGNMPPEIPGWALVTLISKDNSSPLQNQILLIELKNLVIDWGKTNKVLSGPRVLRVSPTYSKFTRTNNEGIYTEASASAAYDPIGDSLMVSWRANRNGLDNLEYYAAQVPRAWLTAAQPEATPTPAATATPTPKPTPEPTPRPTPAPGIVELVQANAQLVQTNGELSASLVKAQDRITSLTNQVETQATRINAQQMAIDDSFDLLQKHYGELAAIIKRWVIPSKPAAPKPPLPTPAP